MTRSGIIHQEMPKGTAPDGCTASAMGQPAIFEMTAALPRGEIADIPDVTDDDGTSASRAISGNGGTESTGSRRNRTTSTSRFQGSEDDPVRHGTFAYVFAGSGKFCNASGPPGPTESGLVGHRALGRSRQPLAGASTAATGHRAGGENGILSYCLETSQAWPGARRDEPRPSSRPSSSFRTERSSRPEKPPRSG
jgi:hypothetical protein